MSAGPVHRCVLAGGGWIQPAKLGLRCRCSFVLWIYASPHRGIAKPGLRWVHCPLWQSGSFPFSAEGMIALLTLIPVWFQIEPLLRARVVHAWRRGWQCRCRHGTVTWGLSLCYLTLVPAFQLCNFHLIGEPCKLALLNACSFTGHVRPWRKVRR